MEFPKSYIQSAPTIAEAIILKIYYSLQASPAALPSSPSSPSSSPSTSPSTSFLYQILFLNAQDIFSYTHSMMQVCFRNNGLVSFFHGIRALQIREYPHLMACFSAQLSPLVYSVTHFGFFLDSCFSFLIPKISSVHLTELNLSQEPVAPLFLPDRSFLSSIFAQINALSTLGFSISAVHPTRRRS